MFGVIFPAYWFFHFLLATQIVRHDITENWEWTTKLSHTRSLTSLELFLDSRDWFQRNSGFFDSIDSLWAFCGFSSFVNLSIIWASRSRKSGGRLSSSEGSRLRNGRTIASGLTLTVGVKISAETIVSSPVVSRFSSTVSSALKGTVGILSIECHSRSTRRILTVCVILWCKLQAISAQVSTQFNIHHYSLQLQCDVSFSRWKLHGKC